MTSMPAARSSAAQATPAYQTMLVGLLGLNLGIVFLDRFAFGLWVIPSGVGQGR